MNKEHWNTIYIDGDVPEQELHEMIRHSYDLIKPKMRKRKKEVENGISSIEMPVLRKR